MSKIGIIGGSGLDDPDILDLLNKTNIPKLIKSSIKI